MPSGPVRAARTAATTDIPVSPLVRRTKRPRSTLSVVQTAAPRGLMFSVTVCSLALTRPSSSKTSTVTGIAIWSRVCSPRDVAAVRETRLTLPVEVVIELLDDAGEVARSEQTVTENISRHGASVFSSLAVERGRFVRLRSAHYSLAVLAVVRGCRKGADNIPRLHLEFIDRTWPLEILE